MVIETELGLLIEKSLRKQSISLRRLSELTNIDKGTLSRIKNGKRKATPNHLQILSECLTIPLHELYSAAGYPLGLEKGNQISELQLSIDSIQYMLSISEHENKQFSVEQVEKQLEELNHYSQTPEGKNKIIKNFKNKIDRIGSVGPFINELSGMFKRFLTGKGTAAELAIIGGVLMYFIIPVDVLPDYLFAIGYLDDAISLKIVSRSLLPKTVG
ncbi:DUF1232 domain-containing protein [Robertmurraya korlensis]|uniref:DUF1232 domain-containing protein n=1 Tax=Robertmurraya korlensis TaxID=519977 RepID=UPI000824121C|nr:DUF1232 domain-containing protein [Robertmurraya korlensis]